VGTFAKPAAPKAAEAPRRAGGGRCQRCAEPAEPWRVPPGEGYISV